MITYTEHFHLALVPFSKEVPDAELWQPPSKRDLVDQIIDAISARESVVVTGEPGVGKTCVLRAVRHALPEHDYRLTYCPNVTLGRRDFYRQICFALDLEPKATAASVFYTLASHVEELGRERIHPVFFIDESHLLHQDVLDHLHIIMNYEWDSKALLSVVLVGLPELEDRLRLRRNRSLFSRLARRFRIESLTPSDTRDYLDVRLRRAGADRNLFDDDAIAMLHEATGGTLRHIDRLATEALRHSALLDRKTVARDVISRVIATA